nr:MAG TPA: hypothetical protein [Caudoviricetes sp.]
MQISSISIQKIKNKNRRKGRKSQKEGFCSFSF